MVINWTKIIILIVVIGAFTGIIIGILVAFRSQCPDGKIYNKTCNKCVTKCDDGYNLPTKDGGIDCDSETCQIDCKDQCRLDDTTCGTKCASKCCGVGFGCGNTTEECGKYNCPNTPGTDPSVYCDGEQTCVIGEDGSGYCENIAPCPADRKLDNGDCCAEGEKVYNGNTCCTKELCGKNCCEDSEKCVDGKCLPICPGVVSPAGPGVCQYGEFCMEDDESGKKTYSCQTDDCQWQSTIYDPESENENPICTIGESQTGKKCKPFENIPYVKGAWKKDWTYGGEKGNDLCRNISITSLNPKKCNAKACSEKIAEKGLIDAKYTSFKVDEEKNEGTCTGVIDCYNSPGYLLPNVSSKPSDRCLDSGVCCDENSKPCGNWCIPLTDECLLDPTGNLCGAYFDPKFKTAENMNQLSKNHVGGPKGWCKDKCKIGWKVSENDNNFCSVETCDNVTCLSEKNGGYMIYYQDQQGNDNCTISNCAINPATGKNEPPFDRCCAWAEPSDGVSQPIKGLPNYGDVNLSSKAIDCKNDRGPKSNLNCDNTGQTCDNWCKGKGLGGGTMHGTGGGPCEQKCNDYGRTMAIPNSDATNFKNYDQADCMQAGHKTSDNILGSKAWIDFGEYCTQGDKVCICNNTALPNVDASSFIMKKMDKTKSLNNGTTICANDHSILASKEELVNIETCDYGWAGTSDSDSGEYSGMWRDSTVKGCNTIGYTSTDPPPANVFCNKDKRVFQQAGADYMSIEDSIKACQDVSATLATKSDLVGNTLDGLGCSVKWVSDGTDDGWKGYWSWGYESCGSDGPGFYESTDGTKNGAACSNANVHFVQNYNGFDITNVHEAKRLCISKGYEGGLATKAQLMSYSLCSAPHGGAWASDGTDDGWKGWYSDGGTGCSDKGYHEQDTVDRAYCITYNKKIPSNLPYQTSPSQKP